jgi:hypothetical protein
MSCKREFPHLVQMHKELAKEGFEIITVAVDPLDSDDPTPAEVKKNITKFLTEQKTTFTNLLLDEKDEFWQKKLRLVGPPTTYVFDRQGKWTQFGGESDMVFDAEAVDKLVHELLKEK